MSEDCICGELGICRNERRPKAAASVCVEGRGCGELEQGEAEEHRLYSEVSTSLTIMEMNP